MKRLLLLCSCALALLGCSRQDPAPPSAPGASRYSMSQADKELVAKQFPEAKESPAGLLWIVRQAGFGTNKPRHGAVATVNYSLRLLDGTFIEASKAGEPLRFNVGVGRVIQGWDQALLDMTKGEKRTLIIPHYLGYGNVGNPPKIPPYTTLVFEVELVDFSK